jgi:hypothetical protein
MVRIGGDEFMVALLLVDQLQHQGSAPASLKVHPCARHLSPPIVNPANGPVLCLSTILRMSKFVGL